MYKKLSPFVSFLGILVLLAFQQQMYFTWHYHRLPDGELVKHYHPFNHKQPFDPGTKHQHKGKLFVFLNFVDGQFDRLPTQYFEFRLIKPAAVYTGNCELSFIYQSGLYRVNAFRGPPHI